MRTGGYASEAGIDGLAGDGATASSGPGNWIRVVDQVVDEVRGGLDDVVGAGPAVAGVGWECTGPDGEVPRLVALGHAVDPRDGPGLGVSSLAVLLRAEPGPWSPRRIPIALG